MKIIKLLISLFGIIKTKALECVSVTNQECMPRPKILDVNEGVGEALFYPYNVLVNKCSGSCNTLDDPMAKLCVLNIIKRVNMKVYNFLMTLNEARNVLWHESCKCVCQLNSSACNNNQIWNSDTCSCDCNEDFANVNLVKVVKRESRIGANIYYIGYVLKPKHDNNSINPLYFVVNRLFGHIEKIEGSSDKYLVVNINNEKIINVFDELWKFIENEITSSNSSNKIKEYNKLRFNSNVDLPLDTLIEFCALVITINCVIEKDGEYYPEINLDEYTYNNNNV